MNLETKLAFRYLRGRGPRSLLTMMAVAFAVMLMFGLNGVLPTVVNTFTASMRASAGAVDLSVRSALNLPIDLFVTDRIAKFDGVAAVSPVIEKSVPLPAKPGEDVTQVTLVGIDPATVARVRDLPVLAGRGFSTSDRGVGLVPAVVAEAQGWRVGSMVTVPSATGSTKIEIVGILTTPSAPGETPIYVPFSLAQQLFDLVGKTTTVWVSFDADVDRVTTEQTIRALLGDDYATGGLSGNTSLLASLQVSNYAFNMFGVFAFATAGFIIVNSFRTVVVERRKDIGMLRAVGAKAKTVRRVFLIEALIQGSLGTALGLLMGWGMAEGGLSVMRQTTKKLMHVEIGGAVFNPTTWAVSIGLGLGVTVLAAVLPARSAGLVSPLEALRPTSAAVQDRRVGKMTWTGVAVGSVAVFGLISGNPTWAAYSSILFLVAIALIAPAIVHPLTDWLIGFSTVREGGLARSNVQRNPGRSAVTVTAVMMGLASVVAIVSIVQAIFAGFIGYIDRSLGSDYIVMPQSILLQQGNVAARPQFAAEIRNTPGVGPVTSLRVAMGRLEGRDVQVLGIDPKTYPLVASFDWTPGSTDVCLDQLSNGRWLIANGIFASQAGLSPGDVVALETPAGPKDFVVAGVGNDYLNSKLASVYVSTDVLQRDFAVTSDILLLANRDRGADPDTVTKQLQKIIDKYPAFRLYEAESFRVEQLEIFNNTMVIFQFLIAAFALPSLLALMNTLAISVLARTREIGMLRAIGATRRQVRRMVLVESLLLSSIGTIFGVAAGLWLGYALIVATSSVGWPLNWQFPVAGVLGAVAAGLIFGVLAGVLPARSAAKLNVVDALSRD